MTPEQKEAAWNAYQTFPIDMCADHDGEYRKAVIAAVEAALAASQPAPATCPDCVALQKAGHPRMHEKCAPDVTLEYWVYNYLVEHDTQIAKHTGNEDLEKDERRDSARDIAMAVARYPNPACSQPVPAVDTGQAVDVAHLAAINGLIRAGSELSFRAQTTGGVAGRDEGLQDAIERWEKALLMAKDMKRIAKYEPTHPAPLDAERVREDDNLGQRCADILQWKKTGVCPDGPLRDLANSPRIQEIHGVGSMRAAEEITLVEAAEVVAALRQKEGKE